MIAKLLGGTSNGTKTKELFAPSLYKTETGERLHWSVSKTLLSNHLSNLSFAIATTEDYLPPADAVCAMKLGWMYLQQRYRNTHGLCVFSMCTELFGCGMANLCARWVWTWKSWNSKFLFLICWYYSLSKTWFEFLLPRSFPRKIFFSKDRTKYYKDDTSASLGYGATKMSDDRSIPRLSQCLHDKSNNSL